MVQTPQKTITLEEFLNLPETKPASEYIDGQIIQKPMPQGKHSKLQGKSVTKINDLVEARQTALAFPELRGTFGGRSIVPDVAVFAWNRIPVDANGEIANVFKTAPDWTIEILSPDQSQTKATKNILHCLEHGCLMGWLIDPDEKAVIVYPSDGRSQVFDEPEQVLPVPEIASGLKLTVENLFSWLQLENR
ncbi:MAG: Uma2 family endonuclease [Phormidesmis sp. CAN_BIN36]|nr:Uma2 family endonuclease [Phormidesmis sp. CAN_BIN36]